MKNTVIAVICMTMLWAQNVQDVQGAVEHQQHYDTTVKQNNALEKKTVTAQSGCSSKELEKLLDENQD